VRLDGDDEETKGEGRTVIQTRRKTIIGCAIMCGVLLLTIAGACWWVWYTQLARFPNQLFGQFRQQHAPTSMCWGISTDGTTIRLAAAAPPPFVTKMQTDFTFPTHRYPVTAISCDFDVVASVDEGGTLFVWPNEDSSNLAVPVMTIPCTARSACALRAVAWKPIGQTYIQVSATEMRLSGKYVAIGGDSGEVQVYSVPDAHLVAHYMLPPSSRVTCVQWSPNGKYLAAGGYVLDTSTGVVRVWDAQTGQEVSTYWGHNKPVNALAWLPDNQRIASASDDNTVQVWRVATGHRLFTYRGHTQRVNTLSVAETEDGKSLIASGSDDRTVQVWNAETGQLSFTHHQDQAVTTVTWDPSDVWIASGSRDGVIDYYWGVERYFYLAGL
jgi:WD40 repeat protein